MHVIYNIDNKRCNCNFKWVVLDELGYSVFGASTEEECNLYIQNFPT